MRKSLLVVLVLVFAIANISLAERAVPLGSATPAMNVEVNVLQADAGQTDIEMSLNGVLVDDLENEGQLFSRLFWENSGVEGEPGEAELPVLRFFIEIPWGAEVKIDVEKATRQQLNLKDLGPAGRLIPVQPPLEKIPGAKQDFLLNESYYARNGYLDRPVVEVEDYSIIRGARLASVVFRPVDYNPAAGTVSIVSDVRVRLTFAGGDLAETRYQKERYDSFPFRTLVNKLALNRGVFDNGELDDLPPSNGFLIISVDNASILAALEPLAEWKRDMGYDVTLVTTTETGATAAQIKSYIQNAYDNWDIPPSFLLLVGDSPAMPSWVGSGTGTPPTDLNYGQLAGADYFADIGIGRFPAANLTDLQNMVDKTMQYEQVTWGGADDWTTHAVFMASVDNYQISEGTHNYVINNYMAPLGWDYDRLYQVTYGANTADVTNSFNAGRNLGTYSGHGSETSWADGPPFSQANVNALVNTIYPFVQSYACLTGDFTYNECFAETWVRTDNGALAFMGSSVTSYWDEDDILEKRVFDGFYNNTLPGDPYNFTWINGMVDYGKMMLYSYYGNTGTVRRYFEMYNIMGDGSVDLWTAAPVTVTVNHPGVFLIGQQDITVNVTGAPSWAVVSVRSTDDETIHASGYIDANGQVTLTFDNPPLVPGTLSLTVTGHDVRPYSAEIQVIPAGGMYPIVQSIAVDDAASGNNNGNADFGEDFDLQITIQNVGDETINQLDVVAVPSSEWLTVDPGPATATNIAPGATVTVTLPASVALDAEDGFNVDLDITMTAGQDEWQQAMPLTLHAPDLSLTILKVNDEATGNGNHRLDPGETASLDLRLLNSGSADLNNATFDAVIDNPNFTGLLVNIGTVSVAAGASVDLTDAMNITASANAGDPSRGWMLNELSLLDGYSWTAFTGLDIGGVFNDLEGPDQGWDHYANPGWADQWHISTELNRTPGGASSWKVGDTAGGTYANNLDACLELPVINRTGSVLLSFYHWMDAETSDYWTGECYDGGLVEGSTDGVNWTQLTMPGYNYTTRGDTGPFAVGTSVYSGTFDWTYEQVLIQGTGPLYIRFRFGSDQAVTMEGWYLDDISVSLPNDYAAPVNFTGELAGDNAELQWDTPTGEIDELNLLGFVVYRDGEQISEIITQTSYTDPLSELPGGSYDYTVTAVYAEGESDPAGPVNIPWGALVIALTPVNPPIYISPAGGTFSFDAVITNNTDNPVTFDAWTEVLLPNGTPYGPLLLRENLTVAAHGTITPATLQQAVPSYAPAGTYAYVAKLGTYPGNVVAYDDFPFEKLAGAATAASENGWDITGWDDESGNGLFAVPSQFSMDQPYPNPFNPVTSVTIGLPEAAELNVAVFNMLGQKVAVLANGRYAEGYHTMSFDGSKLASGIYFIHAAVPGKMDTFRKIVLVK